jgi:hypothetical protein
MDIVMCIRGYHSNEIRQIDDLMKYNGVNAIEIVVIPLIAQLLKEYVLCWWK